MQIKPLADDSGHIVASNPDEHEVPPPRSVISRKRSVFQNSGIAGFLRQPRTAF